MSVLGETLSATNADRRVCLVGCNQWKLKSDKVGKRKRCIYHFHCMHAILSFSVDWFVLEVCVFVI